MVGVWANEEEVAGSNSARGAFIFVLYNRKRRDDGPAQEEARRRERCAPVCADACNGRNERQIGIASKTRKRDLFHPKKSF